MNHKSQLRLCSTESRAWSKGYVLRMPLECQPGSWGAGEGVGWGRKETGVSTGWRGPAFGIKHDKLLKFFRLYSRNASQNSPFGEEFIHWSHLLLVKAVPCRMLILFASGKFVCASLEKSSHFRANKRVLGQDSKGLGLTLSPVQSKVAGVRVCCYSVS